MSALRRASAALLAVAFALLVAGCTTDTPTAPAASAPSAAPDQLVRDALAATLAAGSARADVELAASTGPVRATGPMRFAPFAADLSATVQGRSVSVRSVDGASWVRLGGRWQPVASGLVPVDALAGALHAAPGLRDVVAEGPEDVAGTPATRYRGTLDLDAAAAADPSAASGLRQLAGLVTPRPAVQVWVGDDGRVAQLRITPAGATTTGPVTLRLTDLGLPVDVTPPATS